MARTRRSNGASTSSNLSDRKIRNAMSMVQMHPIRSPPHHQNGPSNMCVASSPDVFAMNALTRLQAQSEAADEETGIVCFRRHIPKRVSEDNTHQFSIIMDHVRNRELATPEDVISALSFVGFPLQSTDDVESVKIIQTRLNNRCGSSINFQLIPGSLSDKLHNFLNDHRYAENSRRLNELYHGKEVGKYTYLYRGIKSSGATTIGFFLNYMTLYQSKYPAKTILHACHTMIILDESTRSESSFGDAVRLEHDLLKQALEMTTDRGKNFVRFMIAEYGNMLLNLDLRAQS